MKKLLLFMVFSFAISITYAKQYRIKVSNFQFSIPTVNAKVGDTIVWIWKNGTHTTTSLRIPAGATPWDAPINSTHKRFAYIITKRGTYNYDCSIHATSMKGKIIVSATLDAGLNDFTLSNDESGASLNWKLNSTVDADRFSLQKSYDGENFSEIASVKVTALNNYNYKDNIDRTHRYVYYQVELLNKNGERQLSDIKMIDKGVQQAIVVSLSPNPISSPGHLMMKFNADKEGKMLVQLYNQSGKLIKETEMTTQRGVNNGHFHIGEQIAGSYYLVCTLNGVQEKHAIIIK